MFINGNQYKITYPISVDCEFAFFQQELLNGSLFRVDRGQDKDIVTSKFSVKLLASELDQFLEDINSFTLEVMLEEKEQIFGSEYNYNPLFTYEVQLSVASTPSRINDTYYSVPIELKKNNIDLITAPIITLADLLLYPNSYGNGLNYDFSISESTNGELNKGVYDHDVGNNNIVFNVPRDNAGDIKFIFINDIRSDSFTLPTAWQSLKPFAPRSTTDAFLLGISETILNYKSSNITVSIQEEIT